MRLGTSLRTRPAAATLVAARRQMRALGISRVTDITRLDRLGLPVFASIRPRASTLHAHAGKGLRAEDAEVGALMEAIEYAVAERASAAGPDAWLPLRELAAQLPAGLRLLDFAPRLGVTLAPDVLVPAVRCRDLLNRRQVLLPAGLLLMPGFEGMQSPWFGGTTNGLASGNTLDEATLHALLEVLERDALAMNRARDESALLDLASLPAPWPEWAQRWRWLGVELFVRYMPNDFGLPCFEAALYEKASLDVNLCGGSGLHLDAGIALARAISEAAQSRLSLIHGSRDDITGFFDKYRRTDQDVRQADDEQVVAALGDGARRMAFGQVPSVEALGIGAALKALLQRLAARGFGHVFRRRMQAEGAGDLMVVKVVVARCESAAGPGARMGPRLLEKLLGSA